MTMDERPQPKVFHRLRRRPPAMPRKVRIGLLVALGIIVLLMGSCAFLFGSLISNALGRIEPTHDLIVRLSAADGFLEDDVYLAENAALTPAARKALNARIADHGAISWLTRPECEANSNWGGDEKSGTFVTCRSQISYLQGPDQMATVVWVKQRANWRVDNFFLRDVELQEPLSEMP